MLASPRSAQQDAFVDFLWNREKRAYATIDRKLVGVAVTLPNQYGVVIDPEGAKSAQELLKTVAAGPRSRSACRGKASAMRLEAARALVAKCSGDIFGVRDRAKTLLGFAIAVRRAELAGPGLRNTAEDTCGNGLLDDVRLSKTGSLHGAGSVRCEPGNLTRTGMASVGRDGADCRPGRHAFRCIRHTGAAQPQGLSPQRAGGITAAGSDPDPARLPAVTPCQRPPPWPPRGSEPRTCPHPQRKGNRWAADQPCGVIKNPTSLLG
ncbi:hypothetical protein ACIQZB_33530 [Streptomyces sp. NPDC097727]|uniref:hypothetical protein n=1 Tax=Streptomyces sp. NPDC097727 TaxID=3366092 RepID=UPI0038005CE4